VFFTGWSGPGERLWMGWSVARVLAGVTAGGSNGVFGMQSLATGCFASRCACATRPMDTLKHRTLLLAWLGVHLRISVAVAAAARCEICRPTRPEAV
jgi:hypothetical protein